MKIGYARESSTSKNLDAQIQILTDAGCKKIFKENVADSRPELQVALDSLSRGDILVVTRLDRCASNINELHSIISTLDAKGISLKAIEQELDTSESSEISIIKLLSIVSIFEADLRRERQAEGIKLAQVKGVKFGRAPSFDDERTTQAIALQKKGNLTNQEIADEFGIARSTLLKYIANYKKKGMDWDEWTTTVHKKKKQKFSVPKRNYSLKVTILTNPKRIKEYELHPKTNSIFYKNATLQLGTNKNNWFYDYITTARTNPNTNHEILEELHEIVSASYPITKEELESNLILYLDEIYQFTPKAIEPGMKQYEKENKDLKDNQVDFDINQLDASNLLNLFPSDL